MQSTHCCTGNCRQGRDCPNRGHSGCGNGNGNGNVLMLVLLLLCFAGLLAFVGPALDDHSGEAAQADAAVDQLKLERRQEVAARAVCGENAGYQFSGNTLQCFTKRGSKTITAKVAP